MARFIAEKQPLPFPFLIAMKDSLTRTNGGLLYIVYEGLFLSRTLSYWKCLCRPDDCPQLASTLEGGCMEEFLYTFPLYIHSASKISSAQSLIRTGLPTATRTFVPLQWRDTTTLPNCVQRTPAHTIRLSSPRLVTITSGPRNWD